VNLAEYRRELNEAHREYRETLERASEGLQKRVMAAEMEFTGDNEKAVAVEEAPARYRDRGDY
jgi:vacuolar-type H+-ATPase subunit D/Vma8